MLEEPEVFGVDAEIYVPVVALVDPVVVPGFVFSGLDEKLHLHLLKLAGSKDEVARRDFVAKAFTHLADAKRWLHACGV